MKEGPILFSTPMVQAILSGQKTMTRRKMKLQQHTELYPCGTGKQYWSINPADLKSLYYKCPYGGIDDRLWVRETWCYVLRDHAADLLEGMDSQWVYKASMHEDWMKYAKEKYHYKWKPSIHMPRAASRITLEIINVNVERLQDISEEDAKKEGVENRGGMWYRNYHSKIEPPTRVESAKGSFETLWESINGPGSWGSNPWVWVIEFKRVDC